MRFNLRWDGLLDERNHTWALVKYIYEDIPEMTTNLFKASGQKSFGNQGRIPSRNFPLSNYIGPWLLMEGGVARYGP